MVLIGITRCGDTSHYESSVRAAGGEPRVLDWSAPDAVPSLEGLDGLILSGGGDIDPAEWGEAPHPSIDLARPARDRFELALARLALEKRAPLLAICRGMQVLNVAAGGSLVQDIPSEPGQWMEHRRGRSSDEDDAHPVRLAEGSVLARLLGAREVTVNSRHHQCVRRLAAGFTVTGTAPDGVVEAMEPAQPGAFCVAVQWHPEDFHRSGRFQALFNALVAAAR